MSLFRGNCQGRSVVRGVKIADLWRTHDALRPCTCDVVQPVVRGRSMGHAQPSRRDPRVLLRGRARWVAVRGHHHHPHQDQLPGGPPGVHRGLGRWFTDRYDPTGSDRLRRGLRCAAELLHGGTYLSGPGRVRTSVHRPEPDRRCREHSQLGGCAHVRADRAHHQRRGEQLLPQLP